MQSGTQQIKSTTSKSYPVVRRTMLDVLLRLMTNVVLGSIGPRKIFAGPWPIGVLQKMLWLFLVNPPYPPVRP